MMLLLLLPILAFGQVRSYDSFSQRTKLSRSANLRLTVGNMLQDYVSECPEENGFFADALQCDRYYECDEGVVGYI